MHPCEPSIEELEQIQKALFTEESNDTNMKKLKAVTIQIERLRKEKKSE